MWNKKWYKWNEREDWLEGEEKGEEELRWGRVLCTLLECERGLDKKEKDFWEFIEKFNYPRTV